MNRFASFLAFLFVLAIGIGLYGFQNNGFTVNPPILWDISIFFVPLSVLAAVMVGFGFANGVQE